MMAGGGSRLALTRPAQYSQAVWLLARALDPLPWPWGEDILARLFVARAFVRIRRLREALAWASDQPHASRRRWRLALSLCAHQGRFVARTMLLGMRHPDEFRRRLVVRGEEHLRAAGERIILLGFHLGPPNSDVALRLMGHDLTLIGARRASRGWSREAWLPFQGGRQHLALPDGYPLPFSLLGALLYEARRIVLDGGTIQMTADGGGREAFRVPLPGGPLVVRSGWIALRQHTNATVLPVLAHLEGRRQVVTIHSPLPGPDPDPASDLVACREILARLLTDYVQRFPKQCYMLAFRPPWDSAIIDE